MNLKNYEFKFICLNLEPKNTHYFIYLNIKQYLMLLFKLWISGYFLNLKHNF